METRRFGRTGHMSTVAIFGAVAFLKLTQEQADQAMQQVIQAGVNHIDVAPEYGLAEERVGAWMPRLRQQFFLGCKTLERSRTGAAAELRVSLKKLQVDAFDLYQVHCVSTFEDLDNVTGKDGALEAIIEARDAGLTRFVGITSHGIHAPAILLEALRRFDFDTVLFPVNFVLFANPAYREEAQELLQVCQERDIGVMAIKAACKGPYKEGEKKFNTWYEPFTDFEHIQRGVNFALSQNVTGACSVGEVSLLPFFLKACQDYRRLSPAELEALLATAPAYTPLWS
jgi:aryl-alcohol dehydrogenase-like predicted oxidoreductase